MRCPGIGRMKATHLGTAASPQRKLVLRAALLSASSYTLYIATMSTAQASIMLTGSLGTSWEKATHATQNWYKVT